MKLKDGVSLEGVQWQMFAAAVKAEAVYKRYGYELTITAGTDGQHGVHSLHYTGLALDCRTRDVEAAQVPRLQREIAQELGKDYDVVLESDHIHVEYDPKTT